MTNPRIAGLASFAKETTYEDLPSGIVQATKHFLLDSMGCGLGGVTTDPGKAAIAVAAQMGGPEECTVLGHSQGVSLMAAVLANGQLVNALDFDTVMPGGHTPPYIAPTTVAMAEREGSSGKELIVATAVALEISARFAKAVPPAMQFVGEDRRFRYPKREGYARVNFGAAAGAGRLYGLDQPQLVQALAHAGHMSQLNTWARGNYSMPRNLAKYGYPGWQNTGAIMSVFFADMGVEGDVALLDDDVHGYGEFSGYDDWNPENLTRDLGQAWSFENAIRFKPYACCTMLHPAIECFSELLAEERLHPDEIERVEVTASPTVAADLFTDRSLNNIVDFQFGVHYVMAMVAYGERTGADWQDWEKLSDPRIKSFGDRVTIAPQPDYAATSLSTVTVTARGQTFHRSFAGMTEALNEAQLVAKFKSNAQRPLLRAQIERAVHGWTHLEETESVNDFMRSMRVYAVGS